MTTRFFALCSFVLCSATLFATGDDIELYAPYMDSLAEKYSVRLDLTNRTLGLSGLTDQSTAQLWKADNRATSIFEQNIYVDDNKLNVNFLRKVKDFGNWQEISLQFTSWVGWTNIPMGGDHTDTMVGMYVDLTGNAQLTATFEANVDCDVLFYLVDANGNVGNCKYPEQAIKAGSAERHTFTFDEDSLLNWYNGDQWGISNGRYSATQMSYGDIWKSIPVAIPGGVNIPVDISKIVKIIMIVNSGDKGTLNEAVKLSISDMTLGDPANAVAYKPYSPATKAVRYIRSNVHKVPYPSRFTVNGGTLPTLNVSEYRSQAVACGEYLFANRALTQSGIYRESYKTASGEDSVAIVDLTINPIYTVSISKFISYGSVYKFASQSLTQSGDYSHTFRSVSGCDSTVNLSLNVMPRGYSYYESSMTACGNYDFHGNIITQSGTYFDTIQFDAGIYEIIALQLTIKPEYSIEHTATLLDGQPYPFGTFNLTAPGTYYQEFTSTQRCDSSVMLTLIDPALNQPIIIVDNQMHQGTVIASPFPNTLGTSPIRYSIIRSETGFSVDPIFGTIFVSDPTAFAPTDADSVQLIVRVSEGDKWYDVILLYNVTSVTDVTNNSAVETLQIFPNEFCTTLNISAPAMNGQLTISRADGITVFSTDFNKFASVNTESWLPGEYIVSVSTCGKRISQIALKK